MLWRYGAVTRSAQLSLAHGEDETEALVTGSIALSRISAGGATHYVDVRVPQLQYAGYSDQLCLGGGGGGGGGGVVLVLSGEPVARLSPEEVHCHAMLLICPPVLQYTTYSSCLPVVVLSPVLPTGGNGRKPCRLQPMSVRSSTPPILYGQEEEYNHDMTQQHPASSFIGGGANSAFLLASPPAPEPPAAPLAPPVPPPSAPLAAGDSE